MLPALALLLLFVVVAVWAGLATLSQAVLAAVVLLLAVIVWRALARYW